MLVQFRINDAGGYEHVGRNLFRREGKFALEFDVGFDLSDCHWKALLKKLDLQKA